MIKRIAKPIMLIILNKNRNSNNGIIIVHWLCQAVTINTWLAHRVKDLLLKQTNQIGL